MTKWKVLGAVVAGLAILAVAAVVWVNSIAGRRMAELKDKVAALQAETAARDTSRPPRPGKTEPGSAWQDYTPALDALDKNKDVYKEVGDYVAGRTTAKREKAEAAAASQAGTLDLLRKGVRREHGDVEVRWEDGFAIKIPSLMASQALMNLAIFRARNLLEEGKAREAADLMLDVCQFARDQGTNSIFISYAIGLNLTNTALDEVKKILLSGKLTREDLLEVDRALDHVERHLPKVGHAMMNEPLQLGHHTLKEAGGSNYLQMGEGPSVYKPKYGFSLRILGAAAFDEAVAIMRRGADIDGKSWAEAQKISDEIDKVSQASENPLIQMTVPGLSAIHRQARERRAQIRLVRTAARLKAGETADLDDPFGAKLLRSEKEGVIKIWSVGPDGVDDGGTGGTPSPKDIVLEVKR
jgi:hypothetical protein